MATATGLESFVDQIISVITNDGRNIVGVLEGFDQATNIILDESHERVFSTKTVSSHVDIALDQCSWEGLVFVMARFFGLEIDILGDKSCVGFVHIIRGDNIGVIGKLDEELDASLDFSKLRAHLLKPVVH